MMPLHSLRTLVVCCLLTAVATAQPTPEAVAQDVEALLTFRHGPMGATVLADGAIFQRMQEHPAAYLAHVEDRLDAPFDTVRVSLEEDLHWRRLLLDVAYLVDRERTTDLARALETRVRPIVRAASDALVAFDTQNRLAIRSGDVSAEVDTTTYRRQDRRVLAVSRTWSRTLDVLVAAGDASRAEAAYDFVWDYSTPGWGRHTATYVGLTARNYLRNISDKLPRGTDVEPARVCMGRAGMTQGGPIAHFGGLTSSEKVVYVPLGPDNFYTSSLGRVLVQPPPVFFQEKVAERRPLYQWEPSKTPVSVSTVDLQPGETVTWTLNGRSVVAGEASPRCDGTDPLLLDVLPAAVVAGGSDAQFNGSAFTVSGVAHALDGTPTNDPAAAALVAPDDDALAAVISALSGRQRDQFDGAVEARPLVFSPDSWAEALAARATVTLGDRPDNVGTIEAPVVAYAPDGARLDGRFEGVGVLVVDGPLSLRGNARWTGLVIARGGLDVSGSASVVGGAVVTGPLEVGGRAEILYSPAALALAREAALAE